MNTNVRGLLLLVQAAAPLLQKAESPAKVVALTSVAADFAAEHAGLWGASQAALQSTVRHLAQELGPRGINVNAVQAGAVETDSARQQPLLAPLLTRQAERQLTGSRRLAAEDVANAVLFLASPLSDLVQGQTVAVDGGATVAV
jgi:enoyl-[acyl-carrier protein] reductase III